jgi:hypothetical protein
MLWHILKKDARLLWVLALGVGTIHLATAALRSWLGVFQEPNQLVVVADLLSLVCFLGIVALTIAVMHQDAVPGERQDWIIRPIRRGDIVLAKLLFVALAVQGPLLLADLMEALVEGFSLPASFGAAAARNLAMLCYFSLPAMMIGAVTRNIMESFVVAVVGLVIYVAVFLVGAVMLLGIRTSVGGTGLSWVVAATWYTLALAGTAAVLSLQYFRRSTAMARGLIGAGGAAILLSAFLPWPTAFALQQRLSRESSAADAIVLTFNPSLGRFELPAGAAAATSTTLYLPLRVTGVPAATLVLMDRANLRIADIGGRTLYQGRSNLSVDGVGSIQDARLEVRQNQNADAAHDVYQRIFIPAAVYAGLSTQPVSLAVDYSVTLFRAEATDFIPATGGHARLKDLGWCATRVDAEGDDVQLRCMDTRRAPSCFTAILEHSPSGLANPETHVCNPDYTPFEANLWPDVLSRFGGEIPFFDRSGLIRYPVDGTKLADARLMIKAYVARAHFTRYLTISNIRLADFAGPPALASSAQR